jgi:hypothetical protein
MNRLGLIGALAAMALWVVKDYQRLESGSVHLVRSFSMVVLAAFVPTV